MESKAQICANILCLSSGAPFAGVCGHNVCRTCARQRLESVELERRDHANKISFRYPWCFKGDAFTFNRLSSNDSFLGTKPQDPTDGLTVSFEQGPQKLVKIQREKEKLKKTNKMQSEKLRRITKERDLALAENQKLEQQNPFLQKK